MNVIIPVEWSVYSTITVENVEDISEAKRIVEKHLDELPLPTNSEYVDGSFHIQAESQEDLDVAQNYFTIGYNIRENPSGTIDID